MGEHGADSIKRAALLKRIGISGVAAVAGVVAVEDDADAQQPYNLGFGNSGPNAMKTLQRKPNPPGHGAPTPAPAPTLPPSSNVTSVHIVKDLSKFAVQPGWTYEVYEIATPFIVGTDETGAEHGEDYGQTVQAKPIDAKPIFFVVGTAPTP
jgi:hypothetical protein